MRAIILAAGKGSRLYPLTKNIPKCLVKVKDISILEIQVTTLLKSGVKEIIVVTGHNNDKIKNPRIIKIFNKDFNSTNMVFSLMCAKDFLEDDVIISYGDIIYKQEILNKLLDHKEDIVVASDKSWLNYWSKRFDDPLSDAESFKIRDNKIIESLGQKASSTGEIQGQYIGLIKLSKNGCKILKQTYQNANKKSTNIWGSGRNLENAYMTDILNYLSTIYRIHYVEIDRGWYEIDSVSDWEIANDEIDWLNEL